MGNERPGPVGLSRRAPRRDLCMARGGREPAELGRHGRSAARRGSKQQACDGRRRRDMRARSPDLPTSTSAPAPLRAEAPRPGAEPSPSITCCSTRERPRQSVDRGICVDRALTSGARRAEGAERVKQGGQPLTGFCEHVLRPRRAGVDHAPLDHARGLELVEPGRERRRRHCAEHLAELVEAGAPERDA